MATMIKEKRRDKKKTKERQSFKSCIEPEQLPVLNERLLEAKTKDSPSESGSLLEVLTEAKFLNIAEDSSKQAVKPENYTTDTPSPSTQSPQKVLIIETNISSEPTIREKADCHTVTTENENFTPTSEKIETANVGDTYQDLNSKLERMVIPCLESNINTEELERRLESQNIIQSLESINTDNIENVTPSAPIFEEETEQQVFHHQEVIQREVKAKVKCMSLEEAMKLFGGVEMEEVRAMAEREEALVESGPVSSAEHPLEDLLSTFRSSLIAVDRERSKIAHGFSEEDKKRTALWKIQKRTINRSEKCSCGSYVTIVAAYEDAEFQMDKLPVARLRLEGLLKDVLDSYCHHQHTALLAHCQIEELISEIIQSNKADIREALLLVLQAQKLSDSAPAALATALERWAIVLSAALLDGGDLRQLLFLIHLLFRQYRSVRWAAKVIRFNVNDRSAAAQAIALLDLLLTRPKLESAVECTEEAEEVWEEVDTLGQGCVVSSGALRELDLLALVATLSLRHLVARIVMFTHADIAAARAHDWYAVGGARGVQRACAGARALLHVCARAARAHAAYTRLARTLHSLGADLLHAVAGLHLHTKETYSKDLEDKIQAELEELFVCGADLFGAELHSIPATLLSADTARDYCIALIVGLHDKQPKRLESISLELPVLPCERRVRIVTQAAMDRVHDHELARVVVDFLIQTGIRRKTTPCKGTCDVVARELTPQLIAAHTYLQTIAIHTIAELSQAETLDASALKPLSLDTWRPGSGEMLAVLDDWSVRCPHLLQHLLLGLQYTPHVGLSLETQLTIGSWLCARPEQEWSWLVLRRLRVHRSYWGQGMEVDAPAQTGGLLMAAWNLMCSDWGHSIPVICNEGVTALCQLAATRHKDAVHCLAAVMSVMAHSSESIMLTPKFASLFSQLLDSGPTLVQRALGRGPEPGTELILRVMLTQLSEGGQNGPPRSAILSAWLHALWLPSLPSGCALLDTAVLLCREWSHLDRHALLILQSSNANEYITQAVHNAWQAPLLAECLLRNMFAQREANNRVFARLVDALHAQRVAGDKIHVDNCLKLIGSSMTSSDLAIYKTAAALLSAPLQHPSQLTLWRLLLHLYLQRPSVPGAPPVGPLFFSGLINSRTLTQLTNKLQETITYHNNQTEKLKTEIKEDTVQKPARSKKVKSTSPKPDDNFLPALSIEDLTGDSSDESSAEEEVEVEKESAVVKQDLSSLLCYHVSAKKMSQEYLRWLNEGEKATAMPHHADIARFIPEHALDSAWSHTLTARRPSPLPDEPPPTPVTSHTPTPFEAVHSRIMNIKDSSSKRIHKPTLKPPLVDINFDDVKSLLRVVDKHLDDIEQLAREWSSQVHQVLSLDEALWRLETQLRVRRPLPPVTRSCPQRCRPITIHLQEQEWCISTGVEQAIKENRSGARAGIRRIARARPHAARSAAALHSVARRIHSSEVARAVVNRAWKCAGATFADECAPAHTALTTLITDLAERWICHDAHACASLIAHWSTAKSSLQRNLCGALVCMRRLRIDQYIVLYTALLRAQLSAHNVFSYLSKFDMGRWSETAPPEQRSEVLSELLTAAQRWGSNPDAENKVLLELLGVHTVAVCGGAQLCGLVAACARACRAASLPTEHAAHVLTAARRHAHNVPFDQLGHLLRELGVIWWEARTRLKPAPAQAAMYAPHTGELLHALQRAFVAAAVKMSYAPERVAWYSWSSLVESWSVWISPHPAAPPLLPCTDSDSEYTAMLRRFVDTVHQITLDCTGTEEYLLQQTFEWVIQTHLSVRTVTSQECRLQMSTILVELLKLPWKEHQWMHANCLKAAMQICGSSDKEIASWCDDVWSCTSADRWLVGVEDTMLAPHLATLLCLFTTLPRSQTLEQTALLPWHRLPEVALEEAMDRFFIQYHDPNMPYHELPQFQVLLQASELVAGPGLSLSAAARSKRACGVSQWTRAACAPALAAHAHLHCCALLSTLSDIAPHLVNSAGEIEELLSRAVVVMCLEPAATAALPVWQRWVTSTTPLMVTACLSAASVLTAFEYFAALADTAARAHLSHKESSGWSEIVQRWSSCPWNSVGRLAARTRLHAAYALALTHAHAHVDMRQALLALTDNNINFIENEVILAVWMCVACRVAGAGAGVGDSDAATHCARAAHALLTRAAAEPRRNILRVVTLQPDAGPTANHRLLSRFAQCILDPGSESAVRAYESSPLLTAIPDIIPWGRAPHPKRLPRLAMMLYPNHERYFKEELDLAPDNVE